MKEIPKWSRVAGWIVGAFFFLGAVADVTEGNFFSAAVALAISGAVIPQVRLFLGTQTGIEIPVWGRTLLILGLIVTLGAVQPDQARVPARSRSQEEVAAVSPVTPDPSTTASKAPLMRTPSAITFEEVHRQFSPGGNLTDLQKDNVWEQYRGNCVEWTGQLEYLDEGFLGGITIGFRHRRDTLTYDVLVSAPASMKGELLSWTQGQTYTYRATLESYGGVILPVSAEWGCDE